MNQIKSMQGLLCFKGKWRVYQERVLDRADRYLEDKRIHIVAAPGSGKTTLGIELIRRVNAPALVLSPTINIRNQWIARIKEAYLPQDMDTTGILSNNIKKPGAITAITYQALHSCMTKKSKEESVLEEAEEQGDLLEKAEEDYQDFDFFATMKEYRIKTLCLDEAHHLRSEWWKALEELVKQVPDLTIISLTATPPYDATESEWNRYVSLCGPIDEEIIVPELVKEKSLCPHQDYVYFNMPTTEETQAVLRFRQGAWKVYMQILENKEFANMVRKHIGINNPCTYTEQLLEKPEYLSSILVFLKDKKIPFSKELKKMLGAEKQIPKMSLKWLERLLQGFLFEDIDSYPSDSVFREQMLQMLSEHGLIQKKKVCLASNENINKIFRISKGKINSIKTIVGEEYKNLGAELRLLILTDYIKKEYMTTLGMPDKPVNELGVVPIFENIRREYCKDGTEKELRLAALSGSVVIIPETAKPALEEILVNKNVNASIKACSAPGYYQVSVSGGEETASGLITQLFYQGEIRVLIGTKSLLGEGWDSPCINSLILASFVGSFMLSNQMRGRAIRIMKNNPNKVSNIWHLVCMEPPSTGTSGAMAFPEDSEDFQTLKRRFEGFLGVHYTENIIENGMERLTFVQPPYNNAKIKAINKKMLDMAADRQVLKQRWDKTLEEIKDMEVIIETTVDKNHLKKNMSLINVFALALVLSLVEYMVIVFVYGLLPGIAAAVSNGAGIGIWVILFLGVVVFECFFLRFVIYRGLHLLSSVTPSRYMKALSKAVFCGLQRIGCIQSAGMEVEVDDKDGLVCTAYLKGGTEREKDIFAQAMTELLGVVDNQRYILKAKWKVSKLCRYYCVPEVFGKNKEDAEIFVEEMKRVMGPFQLYYTRSPEGRKELLKARVHAFANVNESYLYGRRKTVKSAYE